MPAGLRSSRRAATPGYLQPHVPSGRILRLLVLSRAALRDYAKADYDSAGKPSHAAGAGLSKSDRSDVAQFPVLNSRHLHYCRVNYAHNRHYEYVRFRGTYDGALPLQHRSGVVCAPRPTEGASGKVKLHITEVAAGGTSCFDVDVHGRGGQSWLYKWFSLPRRDSLLSQTCAHVH
jgi:hypothetical protein